MKSSMIDIHNGNNVYGNSNGEFVVLMSDIVTYENNIGKFIIPTLTPTLGNVELIESSVPKKNNSNIINKENLGLSSITTSNYIELPIPKHLFTIKDILIMPNTHMGGEGYLTGCTPKTQIIYNEFLKSQKFVIIYMNINKENPIIVGVM